MSTLQLGLIAAGVLLVVAVIAYNAWERRRLRRQFEAAFSPAARAARDPSRVEPTLGGDTATHFPSPESSSDASTRPPESERAFDIPMDVAPTRDTSAAEEAYPAASETFAENAAEGATPQPDPDIECIAELQTTAPVLIGSIAGGLTARLGKPLRWFGRAHGDGAWRLLSKDSPGEFSEFAACLLLADRNGPVSRPQLETFLRVVGEIAPTIPAAFDPPDIASEVERAEVVDRLCADLDVQIGLTITKADGTPIAGTRLRGVAEAAGFRLGSLGRFEWLHADTGSVLYTLQNLKNEPFTVESLRASSTPGVVLLLDVPRVTDPPRTFDQMKLLAKRLALTLGAEVVDDNRRPLDDVALAKIRAQVQAAADTLHEVHIEPGSPRALALYGA